MNLTEDIASSSISAWRLRRLVAAPAWAEEMRLPDPSEKCLCDRMMTQIQRNLPRGTDAESELKA
jgi:hypothetical protein